MITVGPNAIIDRQRKNMLVIFEKKLFCFIMPDNILYFAVKDKAQCVNCFCCNSFSVFHSLKRVR